MNRRRRKGFRGVGGSRVHDLKRLPTRTSQRIVNAMRSLLLSAGLKLPRLSQSSFEQRVHQILRLNATVRAVIEPLLRVRAAMVVEKRAFDASLDAIASKDPVCRRLMTAPQVGALTALVFRCAIDEPRGFSSSRSVGAHFGITPKTKQSGETSRRGRITGWGDASVRRMLVLAARGLFRKKARPSWLTEWAAQVAARRGTGKAIVAAVRRLAVILHHMWISETDFRWEAPI
jgi:transposase